MEADLDRVRLWLKEGDLEFDLAEEPMSSWREMAAGLLGTHPRFPKDAARTRRIANLLRKGEDPWPVFVDDSDNFVLEGRHRIVAFLTVGLTEIPVVRVRQAVPAPGMPGP